MLYKKCNKILIILFTLSLFCITASPILALGGLSDKISGRLRNVGINAEYDTTKSGDQSAAEYIGKVISYVLAMLGVIFLVLLVYGGFLWMTARGDSEIVSKAKDIMINAIIGLIIVLMSYAITYYVVGKMTSTTMTDTGGFKQN